MGSRKKKNKGKKKKPGRPARMARPRAFGPRDSTVVVNPPGEVKMSEVLWEFIQPHIHWATTPDKLRHLLYIASIAWNIPLFPPAEAARATQELLNTFPADGRPVLGQMVADLIRRRKTNFASNQRIIVDFQLTATPQGPHLAVVSTLPDAKG